MKKLVKNKTLLLLLCLFCITSNTYSQVYKNRAKQSAYKTKDKNGIWTQWSDWENCDILIVTNLNKSTFTIYSKVIQELDIVKFYPIIHDEQGIEVFKMLCVDADGLRCNIRQRFIKSEMYSSQLYIDYDDLNYVFNLVAN